MRYYRFGAILPLVLLSNAKILKMRHSLSAPNYNGLLVEPKHACYPG